MPPIFHRVLADLEGFTHDELPEARKVIDHLQSRLDGTDDESEILDIYHAVRQLSYNAYQENRAYLDFLSNNKDRFNISSYFDIPASPKTVLGKWSLPDELQGNVVLDRKRQWVVDKVRQGKPDENFVIIGEPGVGKTVILFEVFDQFMKDRNAGILTLENIGEFHQENGIRLFYDDLPENPSIIRSLKETDAKGIVVSARLEDWKEHCKELKGKYTRLTVENLGAKKMGEVGRRLLDLYNIYHDEKAIDLLVKYAEGTPIYVWLLVKEMKNSRQRELTVDYLRRHASRGMINYVGDLLHRLLKKGPDFKPGGYHTLTMLYFLSRYMINKQCHAVYFGEVSKRLDKYTTEIFQSDFDRRTQSRVMYYLSGSRDMMRFPHDAWADVLAKKGKQNPFIQDIIYIEEDIADEDIFERIMIESIPKAWNRMNKRYRRDRNIERESLLKFSECLLSNFSASDLEDQGIQLKNLRELAIQHSDIESSKVILSKLEHVQKAKGENVINIMGGKVHVGDRVKDQSGWSADAIIAKEHEKQKGKLKVEKERSDKELAKQRADMRAKEREALLKGSKKELGPDEKKTTPEDDIKTSFDELKKLYERCRLLGMDISPFKERYTKIRGWMRFRRYKMAEDLLPGLFVELEDKASSFETELRETLEGHMDEVDSLVDDCLERGINVDEESERYHNGRSELDAGKLRDADAIFEELAQDLRSKVDEADRVGKKRSELLAVLKELSENELDISVPSGLEIKIKNDPFDAEADVDDYWQKIEAEQERRRKEAEERERTRVKALELNEKLDEKASYCRKKDIMVFSGFNDRRRNIRRQIKQGSFMDAVRELETLISQLDEHILKKEEQAKNWRKEGDDWVNSIGMRFVPIPGKNYYMGKYTVTQKEWKAVMGSTPWKGKSYIKEGDDYPATYISWNDCQQFVKKLNSKEGRNRYRLPMEEEWEHACRAGSTTKYCFGDDVGRLGDYAWYDKNAWDIGEKYAHRVGQKKPNQWGLHDMHGNVWEWTSTADGSDRVNRGGGWSSIAEYCGSSLRLRLKPDPRDYRLGVRLVRSSD